MRAVRRHLKRSGVPVENSKGEWGPGQHEVNVRYAEALDMADRHVVFKQCMKELADAMGVSVTFMAKFASGQAGSSCHIHMSLWRDGDNAFPGKGKFGPVECSDVFRWFLGGWIAHVPDVMVFYAPTINSYKRYVDGSWAPTRLAWSYDNRTAGFRVVGQGQEPAHRMPHPRRGLQSLPRVRGGARFGARRNRATASSRRSISAATFTRRAICLACPIRSAEATENFASSDFAKRAFGADVVEHYLHFFRTEQNAYNFAVTDWERRRYFERI